MEEDKVYIRDGRAPIPEKTVTSRIMSSIKGKNTIPELIFRKHLWKNDLKGYRIHLRKVPGRPDIAFPRIRLAIFINGCYWHRCPYCHPAIPQTHTSFWANKFEKNVERDKLKISQLENAGWITLTIWECKMKEDMDIFIEMIKKYLQS